MECGMAEQETVSTPQMSKIMGKKMRLQTIGGGNQITEVQIASSRCGNMSGKGGFAWCRRGRTGLKVTDRSFKIVK